MPEPAADPVADHGAADGAGDHEADLWRGAFAGGRTVATACAVHHEEGGRITWTGPGSAATGAQRRGKVVAAPQPGAGREHAGQAESRERPLARRPARIARPARVRMRRRNPWVLARRRLFGWKVRLLTRGLPYDGLERRQRCLSQGGEPMRPAPVGRPRRKETVDSMDTRQRPSRRLDRLTVRAFVPAGQTELGNAQPMANRPP